jgi:hypothetical protein
MKRDIQPVFPYLNWSSLISIKTMNKEAGIKRAYLRATLLEHLRPALLAMHNG